MCTATVSEDKIKRCATNVQEEQIVDGVQAFKQQIEFVTSSVQRGFRDIHKTLRGFERKLLRMVPQSKDLPKEGPSIGQSALLYQLCRYAQRFATQDPNMQHLEHMVMLARLLEESLRYFNQSESVPSPHVGAGLGPISRFKGRVRGLESDSNQSGPANVCLVNADLMNGLESTLRGLFGPGQVRMVRVSFVFHSEEEAQAAAAKLHCSPVEGFPLVVEFDA